MGCGTGPFDRPAVFRVTIEIKKDDGKPLSGESDPIYTGFRDKLVGILEGMDVDVCTEHSSGGGETFLTLILSGTVRTAFHDGEVRVIHDGHFDGDTAKTLNCKVNDALKDIRVHRRKSNGKTTRTSSGVFAKVIINETAPEAGAPGTSRGLCGDDDQDPFFKLFCCPDS